MSNDQIAEIFRKIANLLEIKGDSPFRIRAYLRAADNISSLNKGLEGLGFESFKSIPGVGDDLSLKMNEIITTGTCRQYEELKRQIPEGVVKMTEIPGVGPKSAGLFFRELKLDSVESLKKAALEGRLLKIPGIKQKSVDNLLKGIELLSRDRAQMTLLEAGYTGEILVKKLEEVPGLSKIMIAGSFRRMKETVRDIDILAIAKNPRKAVNAFIGLSIVKQVLAKGEKKASVLSKDDRQADLRVFDSRSYGAALIYFTGSKNHNIKLRSLANTKNLKINEYGVFDTRNRRLASKTEADVYRCLGLDYIAPELREDTGEVEAASRHALPDLIKQKEIRGDFHSHTDYSDGENSVEEMAIAAIKMGYEYICLTDHSVSLKIAGGLDLEALKKKKRDIDRVNRKFKGFRVLFATEVEIDSEGGLDYKDNILSGFDVVVAAVHSGFKLSRKQMTDRIVRACKSKFVHIIAHPTARQWQKRGPSDMDLDEVFRVARDTNTALEINSHPYRLDLNDINARRAKDAGVKIAIGSDSHSIGQLDFIRFGVGVARRAWISGSEVLNTLGVDSLLKSLRK